MAFKSLLSLVSVVAVAYALPETQLPLMDTCANGARLENLACCPLIPLRSALQKELFKNECGGGVHAALRLSFHDAIGFSSSQGPSAGGGADGSLILFADEELKYPANNGLKSIVEKLSPFLKEHKISAGDLIQFAAAVGITNCPGAPRLEFLLGRPDATAAALDKTVPEPQDPIDNIFARMKDGGDFSPAEVVGLLASHTIAKSKSIDTTIQSAPFDTTPCTFDTQIFLEVMLKGIGFPGNSTPHHSGEALSPLPVGSEQNPGELRLKSDFAIARDSRTACTWQSFVNEQNKMSSAFKDAMAKLAVIGQKKENLISCSSVIPMPVPASGKPATYPATKSFADIEQVCKSPFPSLAADPGATQTIIPRCPLGQTKCFP